MVTVGNVSICMVDVFHEPGVALLATDAASYVRTMMMLLLLLMHVMNCTVLTNGEVGVE